MDKKLTDSEIVKALECCSRTDGYGCEDCPYGAEDKCSINSKRDALDLINRLQAENERLQGSVDRYSIQVANQREQIEKYEPIKETLCVLWETMASIGVAKGKEKPTLEELAEAADHIKTKAYKEFAKRLLSCYADFDEKNEIITISNLEKAIEDCLKELAGEDNI